MQLSALPAHIPHLAAHRFRQLYGAGEVRILRAPARINILGEHIDYVSYLPTASLPFGSHEHEMVMLYRANDSGQVRGASTLERFAPFDFAANEMADCNGQSWLDYLYSRPTPAPHWSNYVKGAVFFAAMKHDLPNARGFDFVLHSRIPPQGGSSSSSALVVLAGAAVRQVNYIAYSLAELAQDSAQAEWYVGTRGGSLDHTTICLAKRHHAVHLRYADNHAELVPLPDERFRWVTFFSHAADKGREIMLEYNERAAVSRLLIPAVLAEKHTDEWNAALQSHEATKLVAVLRELPEALTLTEASTCYPAAFEQCQLAFPALVQERSTKPLKLRDRALHHLGEVERVAAATQLLRNATASEPTMRALGTLLNASHVSLRELYEVSTPLVDQLFDVITADSQVYGARLIGGGFGGNVLALTTAENVAALIDRVQKEYYAPQQCDGRAEGAVMVSTPGDGISELYTVPQKF